MSSNPLAVYRSAVQRALQQGNATEHTHRPALKALVEALKAGVTATNEPRRVACGAPDFVVSVRRQHGALTVGHIEAKDVGLPLDAVEKGEQLKRYLPALENLLLTDYLEFRWYVNGSRRAAARLATSNAAGKLVPEKGGPDSSGVEQLLRDFLAREPEPVVSPRELAERMARLTRMTRAVIAGAFAAGEASGTLQGLRQAFSEVLLPDLTEEQFADMFAQTLAYGLFAARVNHPDTVGTGRFSRRHAGAEIPKTNPFLRQLFHTVTGPDLDSEPFAVFVDDLADLLADADMEQVLSHFGKRGAREDPVVHFYETFLAAYDPALRERRGVYYTPEPVVSYIVRSVDHLLRERFGLAGGLADLSTTTYTLPGEGPDGSGRQEEGPRVLILDPACGTGTFLYSVVDHIRGQFMREGNAGMWSGFVREQLLPRLFGFELLMAPYAVAHLKLGMQLAAKDLPEESRDAWAYDFAAEDRLRVYLTNTLEEAVKRSRLLMGQYISDEANAAAEVKSSLPIMVVLGNPPYSKRSANKGATLGELVRDYYQVDGKPLGERNPKWLQDDYVKFIRFSEWRIENTGAGVLAFITNHGYLDNPTFRGMRQRLARTFTDIYLLNLHGNSLKGERAPDGGADENVFDIQPGVTIAIFVKDPAKVGPARVDYADVWGTRGDKYSWLNAHDVADTEWNQLTPARPFYLFTPCDVDLLPEYEAGWKIVDVFGVYGSGITSGRNGLFLGLTRAELLYRIEELRGGAASDASLSDRHRVPAEALPEIRAKLRAQPALAEQAVQVAYRPFDTRYLLYSPPVLERPRTETMRHMRPQNVALLTHRPQSPQEFTYAFCTRLMGDQCVAANKSTGGGNSYLLPLYRYPDGESADLFANGEREPNLSPAFIADLEGRLALEFIPDGTGDLEATVGPEDVFHYLYAALHSPTYRSRYAEFLKIDFPRVPLTRNRELFRALAAKGAELVALHLLEAPALSGALAAVPFPVAGPNEVEPGHPCYLPPGEPEPGTGEPLAAGRVYLGKEDPKTGKRGQYFDRVPPEAWEFHVGGYQVCEKWLKDRRGRALTLEDLTHYQKIVVALGETIRLMGEVDEAIEEQGGWPVE